MYIYLEILSHTASHDVARRDTLTIECGMCSAQLNLVQFITLLFFCAGTNASKKKNVDMPPRAHACAHLHLKPVCWKRAYCKRLTEYTYQSWQIITPPGLFPSACILGTGHSSQNETDTHGVWYRILAIPNQKPVNKESLSTPQLPHREPACPFSILNGRAKPKNIGLVRDHTLSLTVCGL